MSDDLGLAPDRDAVVFETAFRVRFHEVDALGHVNNAAYLNYLEQAAIDHASFLGLDLVRLRALGGVFVARRHDIVFLKPTFAGDTLRVVTWLADPRGARIERRYLVLRDPESTTAALATGKLVRWADCPPDADLVVRATTEWVFASDQGQPRRIPEEVITLFRRGAKRDGISNTTGG